MLSNQKSSVKSQHCLKAKHPTFSDLHISDTKMVVVSKMEMEIWYLYYLTKC